MDIGFQPFHQLLQLTDKQEVKVKLLFKGCAALQARYSHGRNMWSLTPCPVITVHVKWQSFSSYGNNLSDTRTVSVWYCFKFLTMMFSILYSDLRSNSQMVQQQCCSYHNMYIEAVCGRACGSSSKICGIQAPTEFNLWRQGTRT